MAKRFLTPLNLPNLASDPETGTEGDLYFNTISNTIKIYTNDVWTELQGGGGGGSVIFSEEQPDVTSLEPGTIWVDSDGDITEATRGIGSYTRWTKLLSASATVITGNDDNGTNLFFAPGLEQVYINGVFIDKSSYTTNGTSITLDEPIFINDLIEVLSLRNIIISNVYTKEEVDGLFTEIDLSSTITTASAAAFSSASAYTDSAIASFEALPDQTGNEGKYLTTDGSITSWEELDLDSAVNTASAAAFASASAYTDSEISALIGGAPEALDTLNEIAAALEDNPDVLNLYLTQSSASVTYATKAEVAIIDVDTLPDVFLMMGG